MSVSHRSVQVNEMFVASVFAVCELASPFYSLNSSHSFSLSFFLIVVVVMDMWTNVRSWKEETLESVD